MSNVKTVNKPEKTRINRLSYKPVFDVHQYLIVTAYIIIHFLFRKHGGPGLQHIGLLTPDIVGHVQQLQAMIIYLVNTRHIVP